jgi:hypothetical protein
VLIGTPDRRPVLLSMLEGHQFSSTSATVLRVPDGRGHKLDITLCLPLSIEKRNPYEVLNTDACFTTCAQESLPQGI